VATGDKSQILSDSEHFEDNIYNLQDNALILYSIECTSVQHQFDDIADVLIAPQKPETTRVYYKFRLQIQGKSKEYLCLRHNDRDRHCTVKEYPLRERSQYFFM
jgi:hypothetical protein